MPMGPFTGQLKVGANTFQSKGRVRGKTEQKKGWVSKGSGKKGERTGIDRWYHERDGRKS